LTTGSLNGAAVSEGPAAARRTVRPRLEEFPGASRLITFLRLASAAQSRSVRVYGTAPFPNGQESNPVKLN